MQYICLQEDAYDCGFACLKMQLAYANKSRNYLSLVRDYDHDAYSLYDLKELASNYGLILKGVEFKDKEQILNYPNSICQIIRGGKSHFVLLVAKDNKNVILNDPEFGQIKILKEEFLDLFNSYALIIENLVENKYKNSNKIENVKLYVLYSIVLCCDFLLISLFTYLAKLENTLLISISLCLLICILMFLKLIIIMAHQDKIDNKIREILTKMTNNNIKIDNNSLSSFLSYKAKSVQYSYGVINSIVIIVFISIILAINNLIHLLLVLFTLLIMLLIKQIKEINFNTKRYQLEIIEEYFVHNIDINKLEMFEKLNNVAKNYTKSKASTTYILYLFISILIVMTNYHFEYYSFEYLLFFIAYYYLIIDRLNYLLNQSSYDRLLLNKYKGIYRSINNYLEKFEK